MYSKGPESSCLARLTKRTCKVTAPFAFKSNLQPLRQLKDYEKGGKMIESSVLSKTAQGVSFESPPARKQKNHKSN